MTVIRKANKNNVSYFNCLVCGIPLMNIIAQNTGNCGCESGLPRREAKRKFTKREIRQFINDPYGQPLVAREQVVS